MGGEPRRLGLTHSSYRADTRVAVWQWRAVWNLIRWLESVYIVR